MFEYLFAGLISVGIGIIAAVVGLGGGFLYVPTLSMIFGLDAKTSIGTSLAIIIFTSLSASYWYRKQGVILYKVAFILIIPSMVASMIGSFLTTMVDARILVTIFCAMLTLISLEMLIPAFRFLKEVQIGPSFILATSVRGQGTQPINRIWYSHMVLWGFIGGLLSGVTGTSGGVVFVPALATAGIPIHFAVATSMFAIIFVSLTGATTHAMIGQIAWPFVLVYGAGAAFGAFIGANIAPRIEEAQIKKILGVLLLFIAALMFQQKVLMGI